MHLARSFAFAATLFALSPSSIAFGQTATAGAAEPPPTGKGLVGGILLGAEVVLLTEAAIDVSPNWLYYVGGAAGAVGGGIAGHYLEDSLGSKGSMYFLAGGMLLVIPTTVAVLSATAYEQTAEYTQDQPPTDEPPANPVAPATAPNVSSPTSTPAPNPGQPATAPSDANTPTGTIPSTNAPTTAPSAPSATPSPPPAPQSRIYRQRKRGILPPPVLVGVDAQRSVHLGIPAVEVRDTYSRAEVARFGVQQRQELRIPLLRVTF